MKTQFDFSEKRQMDVLLNHRDWEYTQDWLRAKGMEPSETEEYFQARANSRYFSFSVTQSELVEFFLANGIPGNLANSDPTDAPVFQIGNPPGLGGGPLTRRGRGRPGRPGGHRRVAAPHRPQATGGAPRSVTRSQNTGLHGATESAPVAMVGVRGRHYLPTRVGSESHPSARRRGCLP